MVKEAVRVRGVWLLAGEGFHACEGHRCWGRFIISSTGRLFVRPTIRYLRLPSWEDDAVNTQHCFSVSYFKDTRRLASSPVILLGTRLFCLYITCAVESFNPSTELSFAICLCPSSSSVFESTHRVFKTDDCYADSQICKRLNHLDNTALPLSYPHTLPPEITAQISTSFK